MSLCSFVRGLIVLICGLIGLIGGLIGGLVGLISIINGLIGLISGLIGLIGGLICLISGFFEEFWSIFQKVKNEFPIVFSKSDLTRVGYIFGRNISEKAKLPKICLSFGGSMPEGQIKQCPLTTLYLCSSLF